MVDAPRARRLAVRIREIVASTLEMQVKDPRLGMVTVTDARVTPDLREATVFYTVYGDDDARAATAAALESARGVLRTQVGRQTGVKFTPTLTFVPDEVPATAPYRTPPAAGRAGWTAASVPGRFPARDQERAGGPGRGELGQGGRGPDRT